MFPPLLCLVLLFGLLLRFPLGIFPLPVLALKERLYLREQDAGKGLYLVIGNPRAVIIGLLSARHGITPLLFTMYDKGATMKEIAAYMSERGVTTVRGKKIDLNFTARLLKNRKYIGEYSYRHIVTPNGIPAIVPQGLFDRVQQRLAVNRKAPARHKAEDDYLLTTKLFCGTCGAMMVGESGTSASKGRKYHYYRCVNTKKHKTCNAKHKSVRKIPLENAVVSAVMAKVMNDDFVEYIADRVLEIQGMESSELPALRQQLAETERGIENMLNAIQMGIINQSTKQRLDELEERKKEIELRIIQEEIKKPMLSREDVTFWICRFRKLDVSRLEERRRLIDSFVNSVTIFDDYLLITFNYKDGETRLDFKDIESSDLQSVGGRDRLRVDIPFRISTCFVLLSIRYRRLPGMPSSGQQSSYATGTGKDSACGHTLSPAFR